MNTAPSNPTMRREAELIAMLSRVSRQLGESCRHAVRVLRGQFTDVARLYAKGDHGGVARAIERIYDSETLKSIASSVNVARDKLSGLMADLRRTGGPIVEIIFGLTLVGGGAAILIGASTASIVGALVAVAYMVVGILIAMAGSADLTEARLSAQP